MSVADGPIRVVIADDHLLVRQGVQRLVELEPDMELVASVGDAEELMSAVAEYHPDVIVSDIRMPPTGGDEGIQMAQRLRATEPAIGVVVLSSFTDPAYALALFEHGSRGRGYLLKDRLLDAGQLVGAIREVAAGGSVIDPEVVDSLVKGRVQLQGSPLRTLTPREREILGEIAQGRNNAAIARSLAVTERTVEKSISSIFSKLGLSEEEDTHRRVRAVLMYLG
jgi:DNA-binding NarL/FixJ family response regulator